MLVYKIKTVKDCNLYGFKIESKALKAREIITFSDTTKKSSEWVWDFGDGTDVSYLSKPPHYYKKEGTYTVKLKVDNSCTVEQIITVQPYEDKDNSPAPDFVVQSIVVKGVPITIKDLTKGATSWEWNFGESIENGKIDSTEPNPTYKYSTTGLKKIKLAVNGSYKKIKIANINVIEPNKKTDVTKGDDVTVTKRGPIIKGINETDFEGMMNGIAINRLSFNVFSKYFCKYQMPTVHLKDGSTMSLRDFYDDIKDKEDLRVRDVKIEKDQDWCVFRIDVSYKY